MHDDKSIRDQTKNSIGHHLNEFSIGTAWTKMTVRRSGRQELQRVLEFSKTETTGSTSPPTTQPNTLNIEPEGATETTIPVSGPSAARDSKSLIVKLMTRKPLDSGTDDSELSDIDDALRPPTPLHFRQSTDAVVLGPDYLTRRNEADPLKDLSIDTRAGEPKTPLGNDRNTALDALHAAQNEPSAVVETPLAQMNASLQMPTPPDSVLQRTDGQRRSGRATKQPELFGDLVVTATVIPGDDTAALDDFAQTASDRSPTASRQACKASDAMRLRLNAPVSPPDTKLQATKRKVTIPEEQSVPSKKKSKLIPKVTSTAEPDLQTSTSALVTPRKTPAQKTPRKPSLTPATASRKPSIKAISVPEIPSPVTLPSPPDSLLSSRGQDLVNIDPALLALSKFLTAREPLESKALPRGQPSVWAPGRQEMCETLPYFKSYNSGCYANNGIVSAFMFDNVGVTREYMDEDVIVARMGGKMGRENKKSAISQVEDHDINGHQAKALRNNIAHENPLIILCGDKNVGAPTKMPHRYCVLDWFKPTHIWAEKTAGKGKSMVTIRYRFERLNRSQPSWYAPTTSSLDRSTDLSLETLKCDACNTTSPQVYLRGWVCLNPHCEDFWQSDGIDFPTGELDYNPAFLLHRVPWQREVPPWDVNPGLPEIGRYFGDHLFYSSTRGVVCPQCGRCNPRYLFRGWRCDTAGCDWTLIPQPQVMMPQNLHHTPWDITSVGPSITKAVVKPVVRTEVRYSHNYKVVRYTIKGINGSVTLAKANRAVVSEPGGPDDMLRELQTKDFGLERRMMRETAPAELHNVQRNESRDEEAPAADPDTNNEDDVADELKGAVGVRMIAFGMNFGQPYKFIAGGDSRSFEDAPKAVRVARSRMNWAQRTFVSPRGYQDFNEELIFAYMEGQMINYHDDGEEGLGPRIATLSLGGAATMSLRVKAKYFSQVSKTGVFTDAMPLPLPVLESSGYVSGHSSKAKMKQTNDTYEGRLAAWNDLQVTKTMASSKSKEHSKELATNLGLKRKTAEPILSFHLTHGDIVIMEGEDLQKFLEHEVEPHGNLRFALTCRTILPHHLKPDQAPSYEVFPDEGGYDGSAIREDGDKDTIVWESG